MRTTLVLVSLLVPIAAAAGPTVPPRPDTAAGVVAVQDRMFGRLFGRGDKEQQMQQSDDALRIQQLEEQVRQLTGQVETLTYTIRRLEAGQGAGAAAVGGVAAAGDTAPLPAGPGAPPAPLGQTPDSRPADDYSSRPVDLSGLSGTAAPLPETGAAAAAPPRTAALAEVQDLHDSGRYAMAAERARQVLAGNPPAPVASEARYMLGEALLAQRDFRGAANSFLENYTADPQGAKAPMSLVRLGTALNGLGEKAAACSSLQELFGAYPNLDPTVRAEAERERQAARCA